MRNFFLVFPLLVAACNQAPFSSEDRTSIPGNRMAARADTQGTGILTTSSGTDNLTAFWCDGGVSSTSSSTGLPICTPSFQIQPTDDAGDNAVVVSGLLETGVYQNGSLTNLTGIDGGTETFTFGNMNNQVIRFTGNPGLSDGGGAASITVDLPSVAGGATGYSMTLDFTSCTMTGVASLGFKIGSSTAYQCSSLGIGQYMYVVVSNGNSSAPTVGAMVKP